MAHAGLIKSRVPGRTDRLPMSVGGGSFVIPADVVSGLGEGNTDAGAALLDRMFSRANIQASAATNVAAPRFADGGEVPAFDPNAEFEDVTSHAAAAPVFDPKQPFEEVHEPSRLGEDVKQLGIGAGEGLINTPDVLAGMAEKMPTYGPLMGLGAKAGKYLFNKALGNEGEDQTYAGGIKHTLGEYNPDLYPAKGLEQRLARTTGEFLGSPLTYIGPGSVLSKVGSAIPSAIGSELAGTAAEGTKFEGLARTAGAVAAPTAASALRRVTSPPAIPAERAAARDALRGEGIEVTAGQLTGNDALKAKEATSGAPAQRVNERQQRQLTRSAIRSIGEDGDNVHDAIAVARPRIGQEIEEATNGIRVRWDPEWQADITPIEGALRREGYAPTSEVSTRVNALLGDVIGAFDFVPRSKRVKQVDSAGNPLPDHMEMSGEALHERVRHSSALSRAIREGGTVGHYAEQIRDALYSLADRTANRGGTREETGDRAAFARFQNARREWKNLLALEDVISSAGDVAASGRLTPAMVRRLATFSNKTDYGRGRSDFADLARNANMLMKPYPDSGTSGRLTSGLISRGIGALAGSMIGGGGAGPWGAGAGATIGAIAGPQIQGRALMSRPMQRYLSRGERPARSLYEHLARTGRAAAPTLSGYAEGGDVADSPNPYATDAVQNALDTGEDIAGRVMGNARMNEAYDTSLNRWKDIALAPAQIPNAPPAEQAMGLMGGLGSKWSRLITGNTKGAYTRWTPEEDAALAKWAKSDELTGTPAELAHRSETALTQRMRDKGLREPAVRYKRAVGDTAKPAEGPEPDYLVNLAAEPRAALMFFERAAQQGGPGGRQAKAILNQYVQTAPTKRDALLQTYMDRLTKAGWRPGMRRGGRVAHNPYRVA